MKKILSWFTLCALLLTAAGCSKASTPDNTTSTNTDARLSTQADNTASSTANTDTSQSAHSKSLVVYFSCTGNTKAATQQIADKLGAGVYEIMPAQPYTEDDIDYNNDNCRANREMNDASARPAIGGQSVDLANYDTILLGYPIWWGTMPRIINTFVEAHDLSGKVVLPFCTSGGSSISQSVSDLRQAAPKADVRDGLRISGSDEDSITQWLDKNHMTA